MNGYKTDVAHNSPFADESTNVHDLAQLAKEDGKVDGYQADAPMSDYADSSGPRKSMDEPQNKMAIDGTPYGLSTEEAKSEVPINKPVVYSNC